MPPNEAVEKVAEARIGLFSGVRLPLPRVLASNLTHFGGAIFPSTKRKHSAGTFSTASTSPVAGACPPAFAKQGARGKFDVGVDRGVRELSAEAPEIVVAHR